MRSRQLHAQGSWCSWLLPRHFGDDPFRKRRQVEEAAVQVVEATISTDADEEVPREVNVVEAVVEEPSPIATEGKRLGVRAKALALSGNWGRLFNYCH